jgi:hypothetical protein
MAALVAGVIAVMSPWALADGTIPWGGNGSDNLPCTDGGHWVLAPSFGVESATLFVNGQSYTMVQAGNGHGSWSADSVGPLTDPVDAYVEFTGDGNTRNHLQLSHCTEGEPSPSPSESPSPSPSESPSPSPSESPSPSPSESPSPSVSPTVAPNVHHNCRGNGADRPRCNPSETVTPPSGVAFTGPSSDVVTYGLMAIAFLLIGTGLVWRGYRLNRS